MKIRMLVACRDERRAEAHCLALAQAAGDSIAARPTSLDEVTGMSARQQPDVITLEYLATEEERLWLILHRLALVSAHSRIMMLCELCTDRLVTSFVARGVCGSVAAACDASLWVKAVTAVHLGDSWFARSAVLHALRRQLTVHRDERSAVSGDESILTMREREILSLIGAGMSNKEIGRALSISDQTVKTHLHHIYVKLNRSGRYKVLLCGRAGSRAPEPAGGDKAAPRSNGPVGNAPDLMSSSDTDPSHPACSPPASSVHSSSPQHLRPPSDRVLRLTGE